MRRLVLVTAAIVAAVAVFVVATIPPRRVALQPFDDGTVPGVLHVHTNRSDGLSAPDVVAAEAAHAGLKFIVFTDHGDATRVPDPPEYRSGVLCLDGVEISTTGGHYIAIGMPESPYPLGGEPRDVVDDVNRMGGFGIAAHPDSPKPELRWAGWTSPFNGIEILNLDTAWRVWAEESAGSADRWRARRVLFSALADYPFRPAETVASLVRTGRVTRQWAQLAGSRRVVTLAGADAHAKLGVKGDPEDTRWVLPLPSYDASFRAASVRVRPSRPLAGDAAVDAPIVVQAIRDGHLHTVVDSVAGPASFEFSASIGMTKVAEGDEVTAGEPVTLHVRTNAPPQFTTTVWNGATVLTTGHHDQEFGVGVQDAGVYWVDVKAPGQLGDVAWVTSNPIYVRDPLRKPPAMFIHPDATRLQSMFDGRTTDGWRVEHDPTSLAALDAVSTTTGGELRFRFGLAGGSLVGQVAALIFDTPAGVNNHDRVMFTTRADKPMRVSVQLRNSAEERWQRSVYVDAADRDQTVHFDDMRPMGQTSTPHPSLGAIRSVLFVVDTTNTKPGTSSRLLIKRPTFGR